MHHVVWSLDCRTTVRSPFGVTMRCRVVGYSWPGIGSSTMRQRSLEISREDWRNCSGTSLAYSPRDASGRYAIAQ